MVFHRFNCDRGDSQIDWLFVIHLVKGIQRNNGYFRNGTNLFKSSEVA